MSARLEAIARRFGRGGRRGAGRALGLAAAAVALLGCIRYPHDPPAVGDAPVAPTAPRVAALFDYDGGGPDYANHTLRPAEPERDHGVRRITFASAGDNGQPGREVVGRWFRRPGDEPRRLVIVLPIWGRPDVYPVREIARGIMANVPDIDVFWLRGPEHLVDWSAVADVETEAAFHRAIGRFVERLRVNVVDVRRIVDWAERQPEIDDDRIGIVGFSIGAIVASIAVANEPRLAAGVLAMGAAAPGHILATCSNGYRGEARQRVRARFGWSLGHYRRAVSGHFDALRAATGPPWPGPESLLMFDALFDRCMPRAAQDALWRRMGRPERITLLGSHQTAFIAMTPFGLNYMSRRIYRFLDARL